MGKKQYNTLKDYFSKTKIVDGCLQSFYSTSSESLYIEGSRLIKSKSGLTMYAVKAFLKEQKSAGRKLVYELQTNTEHSLNITEKQFFQLLKQMEREDKMLHLASVFKSSTKSVAA